MEFIKGYNLSNEKTGKKLFTDVKTSSDVTYLYLSKIFGLPIQGRQTIKMLYKNLIKLKEAAIKFPIDVDGVTIQNMNELAQIKKKESYEITKSISNFNKNYEIIVYNNRIIFNFTDVNFWFGFLIEENISSLKHFLVIDNKLVLNKEIKEVDQDLFNKLYIQDTFIVENSIEEFKKGLYLGFADIKNKTYNYNNVTLFKPSLDSLITNNPLYIGYIYTFHCLENILSKKVNNIDEYIKYIDFTQIEQKPLQVILNNFKKFNYDSSSQAEPEIINLVSNIKDNVILEYKIKVKDLRFRLLEANNWKTRWQAQQSEMNFYKTYKVFDTTTKNEITINTLQEIKLIDNFNFITSKEKDFNDLVGKISVPQVNAMPRVLPSVVSGSSQMYHKLVTSEDGLSLEIPDGGTVFSIDVLYKLFSINENMKNVVKFEVV